MAIGSFLTAAVVLEWCLSRTFAIIEFSIEEINTETFKKLLTNLRI